MTHHFDVRVLEYSQKKVTSLLKGLLNLCYFHTHFYQFRMMASTDIVSVSLERLRILENIIHSSLQQCTFVGLPIEEYATQTPQ